MRKRLPQRFYIAGCILGGVFLCLVAILSLHSDSSLRTMLTYAPQNSFFSAGLLLLFYVLKSATIFFPLLILEMAAGYLFPAPAAMGINLLGIWIILTVPYWIGRRVGIKQTHKLAAKHPKFQAVIDKQQGHSFFLCFFLRAVSCLPGDIVTMYLGATRIPFFHNFLGGTLGILPGMVLATFMGVNIQYPSAPAFWSSATLSVGLAISSTVLYDNHLKRQKGKGNHV